MKWVSMPLIFGINELIVVNIVLFQVIPAKLRDCVPLPIISDLEYILLRVIAVLKLSRYYLDLLVREG